MPEESSQSDPTVFFKLIKSLITYIFRQKPKYWIKMFPVVRSSVHSFVIFGGYRFDIRSFEILLTSCPDCFKIPPLILQLRKQCNGYVIQNTISELYTIRTVRYVSTCGRLACQVRSKYRKHLFMIKIKQRLFYTLHKENCTY